MTFEVLNEIFEIEVEYITKSSLAIGAGKEVALAAVESPVTRIGGQPVIPGSSIKGALRSLLEATMANAGLRVCLPEAAIPKTEMRQKERYAESLKRRLPCSPQREKEDVCSICQIFGAAGLSGRAIFLDARSAQGQEPELIATRTHVAITRDTKAAAGGKLLELQVVEAGYKFTGLVRIVNPEEWQVGAIIRGLEDLSLLGLGSKKTAGYGEIETKVVGVLRRSLVKGHWETEATAEFSSFVNNFQKYVSEAG